MPRLPRLQYENAIYHIVTRGDGRRRLFHDDGHYQRFTQGLIDEVDRSDWIVVAYCWMPNRIHALIKTPQPNLCRGMQHWLSGYASWYAKRNRRSVDDVLDHFYKTCRSGSYRTNTNWPVGTRPTSHIISQNALASTASEYQVSVADYRGFRSAAGGRHVAAYLCRRYTAATLAERSKRLVWGIRIVRRTWSNAKRNIESSPAIKKRVKRIEKRLGLNPETRA